ncbi:related to Vault poly[ADP-ribose] polymerase [Phialocephala subalpina]|uniref:Related to Vault poly[ADP-ribose] polymerase n=1 Tax=Phialocephala subalpina TaxID=576137 RepID=A0A1L7XTP0_9HELO|nr:related to Vault poly[ADP-ribose] polymerase [Phialocephala subalpina]
MSTTTHPHARILSSRTKLCGCFSVGTVRQQYLPLLDSEAHTTILSGTSRTVLKQTFVNSLSSKKNAECMYKFPLYDGVSVVGFTCKIGTKPAICGLVKERGKAEAIFDAAVAKGDNAGLLTQAPEASDVFTTRIGNVQAGESIFIEITYIGELKYDDDVEGIRFTIPTMIAPRYSHTDSISPPSVAGLAGAMIPPLGHHPNDRIKITVDIVLPAGIYIKGVESPSHLIAVSIGTISIAAQAAPVMNKASATLSLGTAILEKDFVLIIHLKDPGTPKALLETHPTISNHRALMVTLPASKFSFSSSLPSEIVLVADRSASMRHDIPMLVSALKVFLKSMPTSVKFNICSFGTEHTFLWPQSKSYTNSALQEAIQHLSTFEANYGGTEIFKAIRATIERRLTDLPLDIILFTDGNITDQGSLFTYVNEQVEKAENIADQESLFTSINERVEKTTQGGIRVFSLGIGNKVSHALIEGLARAGKGLCLAIQDGERLEKRVTRMLRGALSPHYGDSILEVKYGQDDDDFELVDKVTDGIEKLSSSETEEATTSLSDPSSDPKDTSLREVHHFPQIIQAPHKIPSLFAAAKTTVYLLMGPKTIQRNPTSVILRSPFPHGPPALEIPIEVLTERGTTIHQLAARKAAQDLEDSRGWVFDDANKIADVQNLAEREAVRLGETFQVVNKWCSFVAVSSNDGKEIFIRNTTLQSDLPTNTPYGSHIRQPRIARPLGAENAFRKARLTAPMGNRSRPMARILSRGRVVAQDVKAESVSNALVTTTTPPPVAPPNRNPTKVLALIDLQGFDGAWNTDSESLLLDILGFEIPKPPLDGVSDEAWVTMLVVRFLEERMPEEEDVWGLVVEKAREYVGRFLETRETLHLLEEMAGVVVGKGKAEG